MAEREFRAETPSTLQRPETQAATAATRKYIDCRWFPSESRCSLLIAGTEDEVLKAASEHAVSVHHEKAGPELTAKLRTILRDVPTGAQTLA